MSHETPSLLVNPTAGNEPGILGARLGMAVNEELIARGKEPVNIIVPVTSERQKAVLSDELAHEPGAGLVLVDEVAGRILDPVLRSQGNFADHLRVLRSEKYNDVQKAFNLRMGKSATALLELHSLTGQPVLVDPSTIIGSLDTGGRVAVDTHHGDFAFPVLTSELVQAARQAGQPFDDSDMRAVERRMRVGEKRYDKRFIPLVHTLAGDALSADPTLPMAQKVQELEGQPTHTASGDVIYTPPMKGVQPAEPFEGVDRNGIYAMLSGTDNGAQATFEAAVNAAHNSDLAVYTVPWASNVEGTQRISPRALSDPRIATVVSRAGWGTGWQMLNLKKPWLVIPHQPGDDPEIGFNHRVIERLGIGEVIDPQRFSAASLARCIRVLGPRVRELHDLTTRKFGTSDGIRFMAKIIADRYA